MTCPSTVPSVLLASLVFATSIAAQDVVPDVVEFPTAEGYAEAAAKAASATYALVQATHAAGSRELELIAAQEMLVEPNRLFAAERLG